MEAATCGSTRDVTGLSGFVKARGAVIDGVSIKKLSEDDSDYGLTAESADAACSLRIPSSAWLNAAAVLSDESYGPQFRDFMLESLESDVVVTPRHLIQLFLIVSRTLGSAWSPYVASLPSSVDLPATWPPDSPLLTALRGTELEAAVAGKQRMLVAEFESLVPLVTSNLNRGDWFTLSQWIWSDGVYWSRVFSMHEALGRGGEAASLSRLFGGAPHALCDETLVPFVDMLNHSAAPTLRWALDVSGSPDGGDSAVSACVVLVKEEEAPSGTSALTISYGDKCNAEMLFHYGFVCNSVDEDSVGLPFPPFDDSDELAPLKEALLSSLPVDKPVFRVCVPKPGSARSTLDSILPMPTDVDILRVCACSSGPALTALLLRMPPPDDDGTQTPFRIGFLDEETDVTVGTWIADAARDRLRQFPTPEELLGLKALTQPVAAHVKRFVETQRDILVSVSSFFA